MHECREHLRGTRLSGTRVGTAAAVTRNGGFHPSMIDGLIDVLLVSAPRMATSAGEMPAVDGQRRLNQTAAVVTACRLRKLCGVHAAATKRNPFAWRSTVAQSDGDSYRLPSHGGTSSMSHTLAIFHVVLLQSTFELCSRIVLGWLGQAGFRCHVAFP